jgi:hypothetical protein
MLEANVGWVMLRMGAKKWPGKSVAMTCWIRPLTPQALTKVRRLGFPASVLTQLFVAQIISSQTPIVIKHLAFFLIPLVDLRMHGSKCR